MNALENILVKLDGESWGAVCRVALGLCIPPLFRVTAGGHDTLWSPLALFAGLLIALRVVPALLRHALPFSAEAKAIWFERRQIAKLHDCYQWQKLFWIGVGLLTYGFVGGGLNAGERWVTVICLVSGGIGLLFWRRINSASPRGAVGSPAFNR